VGWSPKGIDYGAPDGEPVHLLVMYFVPDVQKNAYLKEISSLAKAIMTQPALQDLKSMEDLAEVRHHLLDAINVALESMAPDARARMIQLEVKQAGIAEAGSELSLDVTRSIVPLSVITAPGLKFLVLSQDRELAQALESSDKLVADLAATGRSDQQGITVLLRATSTYQPDRVMYDCLAVKSGKKTP
jgi:hypothetical protein